MTELSEAFSITFKKLSQEYHLLSPNIPINDKEYKVSPSVSITTISEDQYNQYTENLKQFILNNYK